MGLTPPHLLGVFQPGKAPIHVQPVEKIECLWFNTPMAALDFATEMYKMCLPVIPVSYGWHCWCFELQRKSTPCSATFDLLVMWEGWTSILLQQRYVASFLFVVMGIFNVILAVYVSRWRVTNHRWLLLMKMPDHAFCTSHTLHTASWIRMTSLVCLSPHLLPWSTL